MQHKSGCLFFCVSFCQEAGRRSRQVFEVDSVEGVWSVWGEWSECSQTCGVGISQRTRMCLPPPPPPPQTPPLSHSPPNWAGYVGGPVVSPVRPYYPPNYPGQHPPYRSQSIPTNHNTGLPLYRNTNSVGGEPSIQGQGNPSPPFYQPEFSQATQDHGPVYRSPYRTPSRSYNQQTRVIRRPTNPGAGRAGGGGSRRSVSTNREGLLSRR